MYKLLLCLRYIISKYVAIAPVVSVTLGVAILVVVNAVMLGFTKEMRTRLHGHSSDVRITSRDLSGCSDVDGIMDFIKEKCGDDIHAISPLIEVPAMLSYRVGNNNINQPVRMLGIDPESYAEVCDLKQYLLHPENQTSPDFELKENGYPTEKQGIQRESLAIAGWEYRRNYFAYAERMRQQYIEAQESFNNQTGTPNQGQRQPAADFTTENDYRTASDDSMRRQQQSDNPFEGHDRVGLPDEGVKIFDPAKDQHHGLYLGFAIANLNREIMKDENDKTIKDENGKPLKEDHLCLIPGDDVTLTFPTAGDPPSGRYDRFTVVDLFESNAMDFDMNIVFVPIKVLQQLRGMVDPVTGEGKVTQFLIKVKPGVSEYEVSNRLKELFPPHMFVIETWQESQKEILGAVEMETKILNLLLFLIIAVAGFGILAVFFMIVVEKTRDIGIMKSLGASGWGIMQIFLYYSFGLGLLGSCMGVALGLIIVENIQGIADFLSSVTGRSVFDPQIYVFYEIPKEIEVHTVLGIVGITLLIAVMAAILPAIRAARMHPVEALRG